MSLVRRLHLTRRLRVAGLAGLVLALVTVVGAGGYMGLRISSGNAGEVVPGQLYRSAQPTARDIARYARLYGIRTIVNLRGANPGAVWYDEEVSETQRLGIEHRNFRMSTREGLSKDRAAELIALLATAPKPVLIHCDSGADRTGLASALYLASVGQGEDAAERQMSLRYGHLGIPGSRAYPLDQAWEALEPWLGYEDS